MNKKILFIIIILQLRFLCTAQTIKIVRDVICPGEFASLSTDTMLNAVNIGDIICYNVSGTDTSYAIVTPERWSAYYSSNDYTPLSVVFFVDQTGRHGWAVKAGNYTTVKWSRERTPTDIEILTNKSGDNPRSSLFQDTNGYRNDSIIRAHGLSNHPVVNILSFPFYLPAIGQLNYLYTSQNTVNDSFDALASAHLPSSPWWSSTEFNAANAWVMQHSGICNAVSKKTPYHVLPVMSF